MLASRFMRYLVAFALAFAASMNAKAELEIRPINNEMLFFTTPLEERSFHARMRSASFNSVTREIFIGDGDFAVPAENAWQEADFTWQVNLKHPFVLHYDDTIGELTLQVGDVTLVDYPTKAIRQIFIGNSVKSGESLYFLEVTDLKLDDEPLPDLIPSSPVSFNFDGLVISGFNQGWTLTGKLKFRMDLYEDGWTIPFFSGCYIYGSSSPMVDDQTLIENVDESEFNSVFENGRVWYTQVRAGGDSKEIPYHELEMGLDGEPINIIHTNYYRSPYIIFKTEVGRNRDLKLGYSENATWTIHNGVSNKKFNRVWVGLKTRSFSSTYSESIEVRHQISESFFSLPDMDAVGSDVFYGVTFSVEGKNEIDKIAIAGTILQNLHDDGSGYPSAYADNWTYTVFATYDPTLVFTDPSIFRISDFVFNESSDTFTFSWRSSVGKTYSLNYTEDLATGFNSAINDNIPSGGTTTTYGPVASPVPEAPKLFFQVIEN